MRLQYYIKVIIMISMSVVNNSLHDMEIRTPRNASIGLEKAATPIT